jgi:pilus assembly protein CpaB
MNRNRMLVLAVIALLLSGGVTYLAYRVVQTRLQPRAETTGVVVAAQKVALGARLTEKDLTLAPWPKTNPLEGAFQDPKVLVGRAVLVSMQPNEPILESRLAPKEGGAGLQAVIPDGMRAVSIQVNDITGVAGFVGPGTRVDLILTGTPKGADETASKIVLENLQVLAAGQNVQQDANGKPQTVGVVTLLLTPDQAQKVTLATTDGTIRLALRNPLDQAIVDPPATPRSVLYRGSTGKVEALPKPKTAGAEVAVARKAAPRPAAPVAAAPAPPPPQSRVLNVEVIQGIKRGNASFEEKLPAAPKP